MIFFNLIIKFLSILHKQKFGVTNISVAAAKSRDHFATTSSISRFATQRKVAQTSFFHSAFRPFTESHSLDVLALARSGSKKIWKWNSKMHQHTVRCAENSLILVYSVSKFLNCSECSCKNALCADIFFSHSHFNIGQKLTLIAAEKFSTRSKRIFEAKDRWHESA